MSLKEKYLYPAPKENSRNFDCEHYCALPNDQRCTHYLNNGSCARPDQLMCSEWIKVNPKRSHPTPRSPRLGSAGARPDTQTPLTGFNQEDFESFKALGVEVCLETEFGEVYLVPAYTGRAGIELTPEHLALICHAQVTFPGARIISLTQSTRQEVRHE